MKYGIYYIFNILKAGVSSNIYSFVLNTHLKVGV